MTRTTSPHPAAVPCWVVAAFLFTTTSANAALHDRGGGLIYDDVLDITWLQDANYAMTSGYDADGVMTWTEARAWADQLVVAGFSDWRLPTVLPHDGSSFDYAGSTDGSTDAGYNLTWTTSPLAYMHAVNLGNASALTPAGTAGPCGNTTSCLVNTGPFIGLDASYAAWYGQTFDGLGSPGFAWVYANQSGYQTGINQTQQARAWAVHPGDIAAVPEPTAAWLICAGLAGLAVVARRRH